MNLKIYFYHKEFQQRKTSVSNQDKEAIMEDSSHNELLQYVSGQEVVG